MAGCYQNIRAFGALCAQQPAISLPQGGHAQKLIKGAIQTQPLIIIEEIPHLAIVKRDFMVRRAEHDPIGNFG